jgi:hypothetical protein
VPMLPAFRKGDTWITLRQGPGFNSGLDLLRNITVSRDFTNECILSIFAHN